MLRWDMGDPHVESYPDETPMLLCTSCGELVHVVVTIEDRRGGASLCGECLAKAWEALEAHMGGSEPDGGPGVAELC